MMRYLIMMILTGMMLISQAVSALELETERSLSGATDVMGENSRDWLELQRGGEQSSLHEQRLTPAVQDRVYQRYLDSFEYPIPENFFSRDQFLEGR